MTTGKYEYHMTSQETSRAGAIYTDAMTRMYSLVALGIITTAAAAWMGDAIGVGPLIHGFGWIGFLLALAVLIGTIYAANAAVTRGMIGLGTTLYLAFTAMEGLYISPILSRFTTGQIGFALLLTAGMFLAMSAVGLTTRKDLSKLGPVLITGLMGALIVSLVNLFLLQSGILSLLLNLILLPIFLALTVWETKQMKELTQDAAMRRDEKFATQAAVIGSIGLYLNILNIFLIILNLLNFFSDNE